MGFVNPRHAHAGILAVHDGNPAQPVAFCGLGSELHYNIFLGIGLGGDQRSLLRTLYCHSVGVIMAAVRAFGIERLQQGEIVFVSRAVGADLQGIALPVGGEEFHRINAGDLAQGLIERQPVALLDHHPQVADIDRDRMLCINGVIALTPDGQAEIAVPPVAVGIEGFRILPDGHPFANVVAVQCIAVDKRAARAAGSGYAVALGGRPHIQLRVAALRAGAAHVKLDIGIGGQRLHHVSVSRPAQGAGEQEGGKGDEPVAVVPGNLRTVIRHAFVKLQGTGTGRIRPCGQAVGVGAPDFLHRSAVCLGRRCFIRISLPEYIAFIAGRRLCKCCLHRYILGRHHKGESVRRGTGYFHFLSVRQRNRQAGSFPAVVRRCGDMYRISLAGRAAGKLDRTMCISIGGIMQDIGGPPGAVIALRIIGGEQGKIVGVALVVFGQFLISGKVVHVVNAFDRCQFGVDSFFIGFVQGDAQPPYMNCQRRIGADRFSLTLTGNRHQNVAAAPMVGSFLKKGHPLGYPAHPGICFVYVDAVQVAILIIRPVFRPFRYGFKIDMGVVTGVSLYIYVIGDHQIVLDGLYNLAFLQPPHVGVGQSVVEAVFQNRTAAVPLAGKGAGIIGDILIVFHDAGAVGFRRKGPLIVISGHPRRFCRRSIDLRYLCWIGVPDHQIAGLLGRFDPVVAVRIVQRQQLEIVDRSVRFFG